MQLTSNEQTENWIVEHRASDQRQGENPTRALLFSAKWCSRI
jgi:hypothetical protein